ncbi:phage tail protein I [Microvirga sp. Mcv34]|uniref:phage tail protein I n=1 Tax=Microvirga sp. Mcv34 TaxID=2926016 RepID=UPI0021C94ACB|nr:phage tail protein I [Microvirga sp. Mcv34]
MSELEELLPQNALEFERALAVALTDDLPVPLREIMDPDRTPAAFLPFLAAHKSVDLWFSDWPEERKRRMLREAIRFARMKGTRAGALLALSYVDATLLDAISYPAPMIFGKAVLGRTPIGHPPFLARFLVKVPTVKPPRSFVMGRSAIGTARLKTPSDEPFRRVREAIRAAKAPETEYRLDFAHKRSLQLSDGPALVDAVRLGAYVPRNKL